MKRQRSLKQARWVQLRMLWVGAEPVTACFDRVLNSLGRDFTGQMRNQLCTFVAVKIPEISRGWLNRCKQSNRNGA